MYKIIYRVDGTPVVAYDSHGILMIHNEPFDGDLPQNIKDQLEVEIKLKEIRDFLYND